jgi:NADPH:quinone reductase-like Zn-dependent oxidoreductase
VVEKIGPGVTRFAPGDRVASNSTGVLRNDHRFGAYQRFTLVPQELTSKASRNGPHVSLLTNWLDWGHLFRRGGIVVNHLCLF